MTSENIKTESLINAFENDQNIDLLKKHYKEKSMLDILRVSRNEAVHSAFLEWIIKDDETHKLGQFPIREFLKLIARRLDKQEITRNTWSKDDRLLKAIIANDFELTDLEYYAERKEDLGRPDLQIHGLLGSEENDKKRFKIIIENKVRAPETDNQTERYFKQFENAKQDGDLIFYVYITPISSVILNQLDSPECSCKDFIQINYQLILDSVLEPSVIKCESEGFEKTKMIINDYITALGKPTIDIGNNGELIMAISTKESELLTSFYEEHQEIILAAISALSMDPNQAEEVRFEASKAVKALGSTRGDWRVIDKLRSIYDEMRAEDEIKFNEMKKKIKDIYIKERNLEPCDAAVNTPLVQTIVNHPGRVRIGTITKPFPKKKTLFYIKGNDSNLSNKDKILKKFIPDNHVGDVDIIWNDNGTEGCKKFNDIKNNFDSQEYPEWKNINPDG
jgi:hypothetical protein